MSTPGQTPQRSSRAVDHLITFGVVLAFAFGLVVPALVLAHNAEHGASKAVGVALSAREEKGRELFAHTCAVCHTLAAVNSVGRTGPNLDVKLGQEVGGTQAERRAYVEATIAEGPARGEGNMPAKLFVGREAEEVAEFVAAVAGHH